MDQLCQRLDPKVMMDNPVGLGTEDMLQYDPYDNESQNVETFILEPEVTLEWETSM